MLYTVNNIAWIRHFVNIWNKYARSLWSSLLILFNILFKFCLKNQYLQPVLLDSIKLHIFHLLNILILTVESNISVIWDKFLIWFYWYKSILIFSLLIMWILITIFHFNNENYTFLYMLLELTSLSDLFHLKLRILQLRCALIFWSFQNIFCERIFVYWRLTSVKLTYC